MPKKIKNGKLTLEPRIRPAPLLEIPAVLDTEDIARVLRVTVVRARRLLAAGVIPSRRLGRRRLVLREVLMRMLRPERGLGHRTVPESKEGASAPEEPKVSPASENFHDSP